MTPQAIHERALLINADVYETVRNWTGPQFALCVADPPYGNITSEVWDRADVNAWLDLFRALERIMLPGAPIYWWGGIGKPNDRPFFQFILHVEYATNWRMRELITWKKKRGYGKQGDYLFTREECAIFTVNGDAYRTFHKPYLDEKRGYAGYNAEYPAHSEYKRRSNVWDETELLRNKRHPCHKAPIVCRIPIETHTDPGEVVLDLFSGSGELAKQAVELDRCVVSVEGDSSICRTIVDYFG